MPANPPSNIVRWTSRSRVTSASSSSRDARRKVPTTFSGTAGPMFSRIHAPARTRNDSTPSMSSGMRPALLDDVGDALPMVRGGAEQCAIDGGAPHEQMQVVFERQADATVDLHAVVQQLRAVLSDEGLRHADELAGLGGLRLNRRGRGIADGVGGLEPGLHVGEA